MISGWWLGLSWSSGAAYRYLAEELKVLAAQAPDLHTALGRVADESWFQAILDSKLFVTERLTETTSVNPTEPGKSELPSHRQVQGIIIRAASRKCISKGA